MYINGPKSEKKGISFSSNGYFMALAERDNSKDFIGVYFTGIFLYFPDLMLILLI